MKVKERNEKLDSFSLIRIKSLNISICQFFMTHENKIEMITWAQSNYLASNPVVLQCFTVSNVFFKGMKCHNCGVISLMSFFLLTYELGFLMLKPSQSALQCLWICTYGNMALCNCRYVHGVWRIWWGWWYKGGISMPVLLRVFRYCRIVLPHRWRTPSGGQEWGMNPFLYPSIANFSNFQP